MMVFISGFLKSVAKGAAVQLGVSAVHEAVWPRVKTFTNKLLDRAAEQKDKQDLEQLIKDSEDRQQGDS